MAENENLQLAEKLFAAVNAHDLARVSDLYATDFQSESPGAGSGLTQAQSMANTQGFLDAFPDLHFELRHKIAQGEFVVVNWVATGTHTGPLPTPRGDTLPPTNKKAAVPGSTTYQFKNGKVFRNWVHWDMVTLLSQLGLMPGA